ncbi:hypothetical protein [Bacteroides cutis]|nr:hypothetical protein [Bacteroides cutis]
MNNLTGKNTLPIKWHNRANKVAQLCHNIGTVVPPYWQHLIL